MLNTLAGCAALAMVLLTAAWVGWRVLRRRRCPRRARWLAAGLVVLSIPATAMSVYLGWCWAAGPPEPIRRALAEGVAYERRVFTSPRPVVVHLVRIDLARGHRLVVSPAQIDTPNGPRCAALTSTRALERLQADLAINASFFRPFHDDWFLDYRPRSGEPVEAVGATISHGQRYGRPAPDWPSLCVERDGTIRFGTPGDATRHAVSGNAWLVRHGEPAASPAEDHAYARTAVGLGVSRDTLWLVVVDGKQPRYSEGLTRAELAALLVELGTHQAINLDGGGSSTMVARGSDGHPEVLNRPCHTKIPRRQRPVANHLGVVYGPAPAAPIIPPDTAPR